MSARSSIKLPPKLLWGAGRLAASSLGLVGALRLDEWAGGIDTARTDRYVRRWAKATLRSLSVEVRQAGAIASAQRGLIVANHRSFVDIPLLLSRFGGRLLSRADVAEWPLLGWLAGIGGTLYVDRDSSHSGAGALRRIVSSLREGHTVGVFPEGTTFADDEVRPFLPGAFLAAARARVPIIPVGIAYAEPIACFGDESFASHATNLFTLPRVEVGLVVGEPLAARGRIETLADEARRAVQASVRDARSLLSLRGKESV